MQARWLSLALIAALASTGCGNHGIMTTKTVMAPTQATSAAAKNAPRYSNRVVVKYKTDASDGEIRAVGQRFHMSSVRDVNELGLSALALPTGANVQTVISQIQGQPGVAYVEPDYVFAAPTPAKKATAAPKRTLSAVTNDPDLGQQWGMLKIGMPNVWPVNAGSAAITVAVVDTGVDLAHPDLASSLVGGFNVLSGTAGPDDDHGHGTHVAGIIAAAANNGVGVVGVAPHCRIMPVKVLGSDGKGDTVNIVAGIIWAVNNGAKVINMSLGGTGGSRALMEAIQYAQSKDVVCCAAMGNDGINSQEYPAGYPGVIAVGATDETDQPADYSNFGSWISVSAPGSDILSTLPHHLVTINTEEGKDTSYDTLDGTSMATPFVAGLAALVRSEFPSMTAAQVKQRIEQTSDDLGDRGFDEHYGWGRINAARAALPN